MNDSVASFADGPLRDAENKIEAKWEEMKGKVMGEIKRFEQMIEQVNRGMDDNILYTDYSAWGGVGSAGINGVKEVLAALEADGKRWRDLQKKTEEMHRQQTVLEETSHIFKGLQSLIDKWERKKHFFTALEAFKEREKKFWMGDIDKADCAAMALELANVDAAIALYSTTVKQDRVVGGGAGTTRESERSVDAVKRDFELVKTFRTDLGFYQTFLPVVKDLQLLLGKMGTEAYKANFIGFGHLKRMKDLKKVDWNPHKASIAAKLEELKGEEVAVSPQ
jgi:hypothetical protein